MYACVRIYMPICMHFCVYTSIDIYFSITWHIIGAAHNMCIWTCICMYECMYVCMSMYIYVYMYVYICIGVCM